LELLDAVMYGMIPRANTATRLRAPPENRFRKPTTPLAPLWKNASRALTSTPGTGTCEPNR
jgi:hypothetical protein